MSLDDRTELTFSVTTVTQETARSENTWASRNTKTTGVLCDSALVWIDQLLDNLRPAINPLTAGSVQQECVCGFVQMFTCVVLLRRVDLSAGVAVRRRAALFFCCNTITTHSQSLIYNLYKTIEWQTRNTTLSSSSVDRFIRLRLIYYTWMIQTHPGEFESCLSDESSDSQDSPLDSTDWKSVRGHDHSITKVIR